MSVVGMISASDFIFILRRLRSRHALQSVFAAPNLPYDFHCYPAYSAAEQPFVLCTS